MSNYIYLIPIVIIVLVIILTIYFIKKGKVKEESTSILDVNDVGVSNESGEFSYGYEKEETVIMNPVNENIQETKEEINDTNLINDNIEESNEELNNINSINEDTQENKEEQEEINNESEE